MADFAASLLAPAVDSALKCVGAVIKRQFIYLCCFVSNVSALKDEATKLDDAILEVQTKVEDGQKNLQAIRPQVTSWIEVSNTLKNDTRVILEQVPNVESGYLRAATRFSLSKRAGKTAEAMAQHREECKLLGDIFLPSPSPASKPIPLGNTHEFESRKKLERDIMATLKDNKDNMIVISGMGGIGKTTMVKRIMNRALEEHVFQEVVMVVVSQPVDEVKLQVEIGGSLGLKDLEKETPLARVQKLHERLTSNTTRILIVLDDVWKSLNLNELGIPSEGDCKRCTILVTSRNGGDLKGMDVKKVFGMEILPDDDAWFLFREKAGACVDDRKLKSTAKQVAKKCKGLPIALATVGASLHDEKDLSIWKDSLKQLRKPNPKNIPDFISQFYRPLILSYQRLESEEAKSLFLLCCLYPEDADIDVEQLTQFCMGLRTFQDMRSLSEVRDRMCTLIKSLKTRSLLSSGCSEKYVRMHDVVRDVCIFIATENRSIGGSDCTWTSSYQLRQEATLNELPTGFRFSSLRLLFLIRQRFSEDEELKFGTTLEHEMRELNVLSIENYSWTSLPPLLNNLRTLVLVWCQGLKTISFVGGLANLEIFVCRYCRNIMELPHEIGGLKHLKLLDLTQSGIRRIAPGIISMLVGLEELMMLGTFSYWEASENGAKINASLRELEVLTNLTRLEIEITNHELAAENMHLSPKLERFEFRIGQHYRVFPEESNRNIILYLERGTRLGNWIKQILRDTDSLHLIGDGADNLELETIQNIKWLNLESCATMKNIVPTQMEGATMFPHMECLKLQHLPNLEQIWNGPISLNPFENLNKLHLSHLSSLKQLWTMKNDVTTSTDNATVLPKLESLELLDLPLLEQILNGPISSTPFQNLKKLHLSNLPRLKQLWQICTSTSTSTCLPQLESLEIHWCEMMERVFLWSEEDENKRNVDISKIQGIKFPLLRRINIHGCPNLRSINIPSMTSLNGNIGSHDPNNTNNADIDDDFSHLFCQPQKVSFGSLKDLCMDRNQFCRHENIHASFFQGLESLSMFKCEGSISLFMPSVARNLSNLIKLCIEGCDEMVEVIESNKEENKTTSGGERNHLFPNLQELRLKNLSKMVTFCKWKYDVEFPSLKTIRHCLASLALEEFKSDLNNCFEVPFNELKYKENEDPSCNVADKISTFSFNTLQRLSISGYPRRMSMFSSAVARNLVNLKELDIWGCIEIVTVVEDEERALATLLFPKLEKLEMSFLPKLETFCDWKCDVKLPLLSSMEISRCHNLTKFTLGSVTTPYLKWVITTFPDFHSIDVSTDLNVALQQLSIFVKEKEMIKMENKRQEEEEKKHTRENKESSSNEEKREQEDQNE